MPAELHGGQMGQVSFSMGQLESGNVSSVGDQIRAGMQDTYAKIETALTKDDAAARESLLASPQVPSQVKTLLQGGGIAGQVKAGLDAQYQAIAAVLSTGKPAALKVLLDDPKLPPTLRDQLGRIPPAALADPRAVKGILAGLKQGMDAQEPGLVAQATQGALTQIKSSLDTEASTLAAEVTSALRKAFTEAVRRVYFWGLFVVAAGFIVTLLLPEIELRKTHGHAEAAEGAGSLASEAGAPVPAESGSLPGTMSPAPSEE
jgi:hypothetical protein